MGSFIVTSVIVSTRMFKLYDKIYESVIKWTNDKKSTSHEAGNKCINEQETNRRIKNCTHGTGHKKITRM